MNTITAIVVMSIVQTMVAMEIRDRTNLMDLFLTFDIVEFFNKYHPDPEDSDAGNELDDQFPDGMFRFEKIVK